ncbi:MAG: MaoC/PaaZ C-terminal domain-containing protein [Nocardioides sp.]|uniref:hypothetical protein n=1 Tax=Nocardioides sp. TaxID=35761 RepID=UPI0039E294A7
MTTQLFGEDVQAGDELPALVLSVDETRMFLFSAATYNAHRIHYDKTWAREVEGYQDVLVQGPLQAALLARAVTDWIGPRGRLVTYSAQNRAVAFPGQELEFGGRVSAVRREDDRVLAELELVARRGEDVLMPGSATVSLPLRSGRSSGGGS